MVEVTGYTAERMKAIEDATIVDGEIVDGHLILTRFDETETDAGVITGNPLIDTTANLAANNPVVAAGRIALTSDGTPRKFAFGDGSTAWNSLQKYQDIRGQQWINYTPTLTASTTNPTLGTSSVALGRWRDSDGLRFFEISIFFGTGGTNAGSGTYLVSLPAAPASQLDGFAPVLAIAHMKDNNVNGQCNPEVRVWSNDATKIYFTYPATWPSGTETLVTHAAPWAWSANDWISIRGLYVPA